MFRSTGSVPLHCQAGIEVSSKLLRRILYLVDANTFASMTLLNRKWRRISDAKAFYAHHLRCQPFSLTDEAKPNLIYSHDHSALKRRFLAEIRRNTFDVFRRPRRTVVTLTSASLSSSTAFPGGEAFRFVFSPNGHIILCMASSRIIVLDVTADPLAVRHELKTRRRPLSAAISDDGSLLAVVSSTHQVNVYRISYADTQHIQALALNDEPRALALTPTGCALAIAYNNCIEVYALDEGAVASEKRTVQCDPVDSLSFSLDGTVIFGSSLECGRSVLLTITASSGVGTEPELPVTEACTRPWTTQILFPNTMNGYSHACLLPMHPEGDGHWILGYDTKVSAFRAVRSNNPSAGTTCFASPLSNGEPHELLPLMVPAPDCNGDLIVLGFQDCGLWLYGVPKRLDGVYTPSSPTETNGHGIQSNDEAENYARLSQTVGHPTLLRHGHKLTDMPGLTAASWVGREHPIRRLVAVAPGGVSAHTIGEEDIPIDGGRVIILDFERSPKDGTTKEIEIEIGETMPKILEEPSASMDTEIELERRRTRLLRHNTLALHPRTAARPPVSESFDDQKRALEANGDRVSSNVAGHTDFALPQVPDIPYDNTQPRSRDTLHRAATVAAATRERATREHRRMSNRTLGIQVPHESDADRWIPPPPPYSRDSGAPLPDRLTQTLRPTRTSAAQGVGTPSSQAPRARTGRSDNVVRDTSAARPQSALLQRFNTLARFRSDSNTRNSQGDDLPHNQGRSVLHRRRRGNRASLAVPDILPAENRPPEQPAATSGQRRPNGLLSLSQPARIDRHSMTIPDLPSSSHITEWQETALMIQNASIGISNRPLSVSTPDLHTPEPPISEEPAQNPTPIPALEAPQDRDPQPTRETASAQRRPSREPGRPQLLSRNSWRQRIEEWNENTIQERKKKSRSKCAAM